LRTTRLVRGGENTGRFMRPKRRAGVTRQAVLPCTPTEGPVGGRDSPAGISVWSGLRVVKTIPTERGEKNHRGLAFKTCIFCPSADGRDGHSTVDASKIPRGPRGRNHRWRISDNSGNRFSRRKNFRQEPAKFCGEPRCFVRGKPIHWLSAAGAFLQLDVQVGRGRQLAAHVIDPANKQRSRARASIPRSRHQRS